MFHDYRSTLRNFHSGNRELRGHVLLPIVVFKRFVSWRILEFRNDVQHEHLVVRLTAVTVPSKKYGPRIPLEIEKNSRAYADFWPTLYMYKNKSCEINLPLKMYLVSLHFFHLHYFRVAFEGTDPLQLKFKTNKLICTSAGNNFVLI